LYLFEVGDHAAALRELLDRERGGLPMSVWEHHFLALELYFRGRFQEAIIQFDRIIARGGDTTCFEVSRCYIIPELQDGRARALAAHHNLRPSGVHEIYTPTVLSLLGRNAEAQAAFRAIRERKLRNYGGRTEWLGRLLDYNAGRIDADELIAAAGASRLDRVEAHYFIGLARLGEGDRAGAREHFRQCADTHVLMFFEYHWARAFLNRLEQDPTWPPWLPMNPE
jgi:tetratricopeptide (TPR) repeat protein